MEQKLGPDVSCHLAAPDDKLAKLREKRVKGRKLKVGVFGLTGCAGCQLTILFAQEKFLGFLNMVDVLSVPFIKEQNYKGAFDIIILEGLVASKEDRARALELRERCDILVALGACAVHGCVPAMKNFLSGPEVERAAYAKVDSLNSLDATPVSRHVLVDYELPGCPPDGDQVFRVLTDLVLGRPPRITKNPVCVECAKREVDCLLLKGKLCLGPITTGGCNAVCTAAGHECMGCRGPTEDCNLQAFISLLVSKGHDRDQIERRLKTYAGLAVAQAEKAQGIVVPAGLELREPVVPLGETPAKRSSGIPRRTTRSRTKRMRTKRISAKTATKRKMKIKRAMTKKVPTTKTKKKPLTTKKNLTTRRTTKTTAKEQPRTTRRARETTRTVKRLRTATKRTTNTKKKQKKNKRMTRG